MDEYLSIIWYEEEISEAMKNTLQTIHYRLFICTEIGSLRRTVEENLSQSEKIILVLSGTMKHETLLNYAHNERRIVSIFLLISESDHIFEAFNKIAGVFATYEALEKKMLLQARMLNNQAINFNVDDRLAEMTMDDLISNPETILFDAHCRYSPDRFITPSEKEKLLKYCRMRYLNNPLQLRLIDQFERTYQSKDAIRWYSKDCFLFSSLNKCLRKHSGQVYDCDMVSFAADLSMQLQLQWKQQKSQDAGRGEAFHVYRGLNLPESEVSRIQSYLNKVITTKGFLSTTRSILVAHMFAANVIFDIEIDPKLENIIYADITSYSQIPDEEEILIDFDATFRVTNITQEENLIWIVHLVSVDKLDDVINAYIGIKRAQCEQDIMIANALLFFGHHEQTLRFLHDTIAQTDDDIRKFELNRKLGEIYAQSGNLTSAIEVLEEANKIGSSLELDENEFRSLKFLLAIMYACSEEHVKAFEYLEIYVDFPNPQPYSLPRLTATDRLYLVTYETLFNFEAFEPAYKYLCQCLSTQNEQKSKLCMVHFYIGLILLKCKEQGMDHQLDESLMHLKECGRLLSEDWIDCIAMYYYGLGLGFESKTYYLAALSVYRNIIYIRNGFQYGKKWILLVYIRIATCHGALRNYEKAVQIYNQVIDRSLIYGDYILAGKVRAHLGLLHREANQYDEAIKQFIAVSSLLNSTEEPFVFQIYLIIAETYMKNDDLNNALLYYSKFLTHCYGSNSQHELWCDTCERIVLLHYSNDQFNESLTHAKKLLEYRMENTTDFDEQIMEAQLMVALCCIRNSAWHEAIDYYTMAYDTLTRIAMSTAYKEYDLLISDRGLLIQAMLAMIYRKVSNYDQAIFHAKVALDTEEKRFSRDKDIISSCYDFIGFCYCAKRDYDSALLSCTRGLNFLQTFTYDSETKYYHLYHSLSTIEFERGDLGHSYIYCMKGIQNLIDKSDSNEKKAAVPYFISLMENILRHDSLTSSIIQMSSDVNSIPDLEKQIWKNCSMNDSHNDAPNIISNFSDIHKICLPYFSDPHPVIYSMLNT